MKSLSPKQILSLPPEQQEAEWKKLSISQKEMKNNRVISAQTIFEEYLIPYKFRRRDNCFLIYIHGHKYLYWSSTGNWQVVNIGYPSSTTTYRSKDSRDLISKVTKFLENYEPEDLELPINYLPPDKHWDEWV